MAAEDAPQGQPETFDRTVLAEGLEGILRAGRRVAAGRRQQGRDADLVEADQHHKGEDEDFPDAIMMAKRCYDLGIHVYATKDTARAISSVGIHVQTVADPKISDEIIKNTYRTLMTRGMKGCYVYCTDKELAEYLKNRL